MRHPFVRLVAAFGVGLAVLSTAPSAARQDVTTANSTSISAAEFFTPTKVWKAHLSMSADAWRAMQPRSGATGGGFGFGGSRFLGPPGGRNGVAARQGIEFDYVHATLQINDWTFPDVAVRYKGNGSYLRASRSGSDKISLKVDLNRYVKGQKLAGLTTINFQNNITDVGWMNEVLAYRLYRDAGALAPRTTYAQVYLTVDGQRREALPRPLLGLRERGRELRRGAVRHEEGRHLQAIDPGTVHRLGSGLDGLRPVVRSQDRLDRRAEAAGHRAWPARVARNR